MGLVNIDDLSLVEEDIKSQLATLAATAFNKPLEQLTNDDILLLIDLEVNTYSQTLKITAEETRRTRIDFCNFRYGGEVTVALPNFSEICRSRIEASENKIQTLISLSAKIRSFLSSKFSRIEEQLRADIWAAERKDGLEAIPGSRWTT